VPPTDIPGRKLPGAATRPAGRPASWPGVSWPGVSWPVPRVAALAPDRGVGFTECGCLKDIVAVGGRRYDMVFMNCIRVMIGAPRPDEGIHCDSSRFRRAPPSRPL